MTDGDSRRRGATPRFRPTPTQPPEEPAQPTSWFDRWLDRLVVLIVSIALLVGGLALAMHLYY